MGKFCQQCGKVKEYQDKPVCLSCFKKDNKRIGQGQINKNKDEGGIDLTKEISLQLWIIIAIFIAGFILGKFIM